MRLRNFYNLLRKRKEELLHEDFLNQMPNEDDRIEYIRNYKLRSKSECERLADLLRSLPKRRLSLREQELIFARQDEIMNRIADLEEMEIENETLEAMMDCMDDIFIGDADPVINPALKENLYQTWVQSPTQWTLEKLAQKFRLKKVRVRAILMLIIDEKRLMKTRPSAVLPLGDSLDYDFAIQYGMIGKNQQFVDETDERYIMDYKTSPFNHVFGVTDEVCFFFCF